MQRKKIKANLSEIDFCEFERDTSQKSIDATHELDYFHQMGFETELRELELEPFKLFSKDRDFTLDSPLLPSISNKNFSFEDENPDERACNTAEDDLKSNLVKLQEETTRLCIECDNLIRRPEMENEQISKLESVKRQLKLNLKLPTAGCCPSKRVADEIKQLEDTLLRQATTIKQIKASSIKPIPKQRKKKYMPKNAIKFLRDWFERNKSHPYPSEDTKKVFSERLEVPLKQITTWFINERNRKWDRNEFDNTYYNSEKYKRKYRE